MFRDIKIRHIKHEHTWAIRTSQYLLGETSAHQNIPVRIRWDVCPSEHPSTYSVRPLSNSLYLSVAVYYYSVDEWDLCIAGHTHTHPHIYHPLLFLVIYLFCIILQENLIIAVKLHYLVILLSAKFWSCMVKCAALSCKLLLNNLCYF